MAGKQYLGVPSGLAWQAETGRTWQTEAIGRYAGLLVDMAREHPKYATPDFLDRIERALNEYDTRGRADEAAHLERASATAQATP